VPVIADLAPEEAVLRTMGDTVISRSMDAGPKSSDKNGGIVAIGRGVCTLTGTAFSGLVEAALLGSVIGLEASVGTPLAVADCVEMVTGRDWGGGALDTERLDELKSDKGESMDEDESMDSTDSARFRVLGKAVETVDATDGSS
jgi:hypothetical protein